MSNRYPGRNPQRPRRDSRPVRPKRDYSDFPNDNSPGKGRPGKRAINWRRWAGRGLTGSALLYAGYEVGKYIAEEWSKDQNWVYTSPGGYVYDSSCTQPTPQIGAPGWSAYSYPCGAYSPSYDNTQPLWGVAPWAYWWGEYMPDIGNQSPNQIYGVADFWKKVDGLPVDAYHPPYVIPGQMPEIFPDIWNYPYAPPVRRPRYDEEADPRTRPRRRPRPAQRPGRPPKDTKEKKTKAQSAVRRFLGHLLSNYSELIDVLEALHDALPKEFQSDSKKPQDMFKALWEHIDKVDMGKAMENMLWDIKTDPIYAEEVFDKIQTWAESNGIELGDLKGLGGDSSLWGMH